MKRRTFIYNATVATSILVIPALSQCGRAHRPGPEAQPRMLARFCDENAIRSIGNQYLAATPAENTRDRLTQLILGDFSRSEKASADKSTVIQWIDQKIHNDFDSKHTLIIDGWVLATTEARQCALFSLD